MSIRIYIRSYLSVTLAATNQETTMLKPSAPMPGMTDTLDFVKNLWGSMQIPGTGLPGMPGIATPPMSTDDLEKRIADLRAVESWLNLNLTMLRGTIQTLEVQRGTLATLKSMGASMAEAMRQSGVSAEKMGATPFAAFFGAPAQGGGAAKTAAPAAPAAKPGAPAPSAAAPGAGNAGNASSAGGGGTAQPGTAAPQAAAAPDAQANAASMAIPAAVAWWNMLQDQFTQAVSSAMAPAPAPAPAENAGGVPKAEPAQPAPKAGNGATSAGNGSEGGNGKRPSRSKTDKGAS
jgi:hypothetical protein